MDSRESIEKTKKGFEESFRLGTYYNKQTNDEKHLQQILQSVPVESGMKILDLGTGSGYLAFPFAERYPQAEIVGLDIVEKALAENRRKAEQNGLCNLGFVSYDGVEFPFGDNSFDIVITRYSLHHFPTIEHTFSEIGRVLKKNGLLFLSDPAPNDDDESRFVDEYMLMKNDGHIRFYTKDEWVEIGRSAGLRLIEGFETSIRFPRKKSASVGFDDIIKRHDEKVIKGYCVEIIGDEILITEKVNNLLFCNDKY